MSRRLGTLTLDLIARTGGFTQPINNARNQSNSAFADMRQSANKYAKSFYAVSTSVIASSLALASGQAAAAKEISINAKLASASAQEMQIYAEAAKSVNIQQDQLADMLKDVNEKFGEFAATGGGGAADFFEDVAPKIGVTIEQFQKLSGPEALQLYKDSLDKAGVSEKQQIFYLESLASDTSKLIPLLAEGGRGFDEQSESMLRHGSIMSDEAIAKAKMFGEVEKDVNNQLNAVKNNIAEAVIPIFLDLAAEFKTTADEGAGFSIVGAVVHTTLATIAKVGMGVYHTLKIVGKSIGALMAIAVKADKYDFDGAKQVWKEYTSDISDYAAKAAESIENIGSGNASADSVKKTIAQLKTTTNDNTKSTLGFTKRKTTSHQTQDSKRLDTIKKAHALEIQLEYDYASDKRKIFLDLKKEIEKIESSSATAKDKMSYIQRASENARKQVEIIKNTQQLKDNNYKRELAALKTWQNTKEIVLKREYDAKRDNIRFNSKLTEQQKKETINALDMSEAHARLKIKELKKYELAKLNDVNKTALQLITQEFEHKKRMLQLRGDLDVTTKKSMMQALNKEERNKKDNVQTSAMGAYKRQSAEYAQDTSLLELDEKIKNQKKIANDARDAEVINAQEHAERMQLIESMSLDKRLELQLTKGEAIASSATQITAMLFGKHTAAHKTMLAFEKAIAIRRSILSIKTAIASAAASAPFPANLGVIATVAAQTASIVSSIRAVAMPVVGQAHNGIANVPREGTWILDKGERVIKPSDNDKLTRFLDNPHAAQTQTNNIDIQINIKNGDAVTDIQTQQAQSRQLAKTLTAKIKEVLMSEQRPGGILSKP